VPFAANSRATSLPQGLLAETARICGATTVGKEGQEIGTERCPGKELHRAARPARPRIDLHAAQVEPEEVRIRILLRVEQGRHQLGGAGSPAVPRMMLKSMVLPTPPVEGAAGSATSSCAGFCPGKA